MAFALLVTVGRKENYVLVPALFEDTRHTRKTENYNMELSFYPTIFLNMFQYI